MLGVYDEKAFEDSEAAYYWLQGKKDKRTDQLLADISLAELVFLRDRAILFLRCVVLCSQNIFILSKTLIYMEYIQSVKLLDQDRGKGKLRQLRFN